MSHIKHFDLNTKGRDFFTTDIHGCFDLLHEQMSLNSFDCNKDRLFVGGDNCDRGKDSKYILDYICEPWYHSIAGNHESLLVAAYENEFKGAAAQCLYQNGGEWYFDCNEQDQKAIYNVFKSLPLAIEVETKNGLVGIVHADAPYGDWNRFKNMNEVELEWNGYNTSQWSRKKYDSDDKSVVKNIYKVYCGHTPTSSGDVETLGNVYFSDLGSFFRDKISFIQIN